MRKFTFLFLFAVLLSTLGANAQIVISQVYGGGGNSGATLKNDFIELYNRGTAAVTLTNWSIQYASATGTFGYSNKHAIPNGTIILPGRYYLIQEAKGSGGTVDLPTPDLAGTLALSGTNGKVALCNDTTLLTAASFTLSNPTGVTIVDFVGFGTANQYEGTGATPALTSTTAAIRAGKGATDTNDNKADFTTGTPNPRNSAYSEAAALSPTITPGSGNIYNSITVTITAAAGTSVYYTTNGIEPTNASTLYTEPFTVSTTTTVKAIAYETGKNPSPVASATYTMSPAIDIPNISGLRSVAMPSTEVYKLTGEAVLTLQSATRNVKYIQDATGAIIIDDASKKITTAYNLGDGITGIVGTLALYQNMLQFTPIADPGAATSTGKTITPLALTLGDMISHQAELVKVTGVTISDIDGGTGLFQASKSYNLNGSTNPILRTQYADLDYIGAAIPSAPLDMVGVVLVYTTTAQFVPRSLAEMVTTGVSTVKQNLKIFAANGKINFEATDGELVEVYNTVGQKVLSAVTISGNNSMAVNAKGVVFVKVGNRTGKVIL